MDLRLTVARGLDRLAHIVGPSDLGHYRDNISTDTSEETPQDSSEVSGTTQLPRASLLLYSHRKAFTRLQELHDRALDASGWDPKVVSAELQVEAAASAYSRSLGAALGSLGVATPAGRQAIAEELTKHIIEVDSLRGLEGLVLSSLAATIESRTDAYDNLREAAKGLGFDGQVAGGTGGVTFMDVRNGSISFVGEAAIQESFDTIDAVVGKPGEEPPFMGGPPGSQSSDPELVGMSTANAGLVGTAAGVVVGVVVGALFAAATIATGGAAAPVAVAVTTGLVGEMAGVFTGILVAHIAEDPPASTEDGKDGGEPAGQPPVDGGTIMPNPTEDGVPVVDIAYMNKVLEMHKPRTSDDGSSGRSFWTQGELLVDPVDILTNPPLEEYKYSLEYPIDIDVILNSRKRPVNPDVGASADYDGEGDAPDLIVGYGSAAMPFVGSEGAPGLPLP